MAPIVPTYIYKIVPSTGAALPSPLPASLPVSQLDMRDCFIHASTSSQLLGTLNKFFANAESVHLLRIPYTGVKDVVKWESTDGTPGEAGQTGCFPHLYNGLKVGRDEVDRVTIWQRDADKWSAKTWPFGDVDCPV